MIHTFDSTQEAYDACQCREEITRGDLLYIPSEGVVGIADTWPVAITKEHGALHGHVLTGDEALLANLEYLVAQQAKWDARS